MQSPRPLGAEIKSDFPILSQSIHGHPLVYLDNAATSQKPRCVIDALSRFYVYDNANVHRGLHELSNRATAQFEQARERIARFIGATSSEIIFTRGTTESINLVANTWGAQSLKKDDVILLTEMEHHSNIVPWQLLAERTGARIDWIPVIPGDEALLDLPILRQKLAARPRLFSFVHISNSLGVINPAASLCALARSHGVTTLVDAAQSAGHLPIDVAEIGCDFMAFSGHKLCGPTGIGALYARASLLDTLPPWQGGGEMIARVDFDRSTFKPAPHRFEAGTPDIAGAIGMAVAVDYLDLLGRDRIFEHDTALAADCAARLAAIPGIRILGPTSGRAGLVSFALQAAHAHDVVEMANREGIALRGGHHCTQPLMRKLGLASTARASFYFYNTPADVDHLVDTIENINTFFQA